VNPRDTAHQIALKTGRLAETFIFHPETVARGKELGLDGFRFYFLGRGGVLGDVDAAVVHAAFGYFSPDLIGKMWTSAKEQLDPRQAAREYIACAHNHGRARLEESLGSTPMWKLLEPSSLPPMTLVSVSSLAGGRSRSLMTYRPPPTTKRSYSGSCAARLTWRRFAPSG